MAAASAAAPLDPSDSPVNTSSVKRKRRLADLSPEEIDEIVALRGKMPQAVVGKRFGIEQTEVSAIQRSQKAKTARLGDDHEKKSSVKRVKNVEVSIPIAYGTISYWLGKKADELHSHKWTAYIRSANNEDLGAVIKRVVFQLHPSFNNPTRVVESAPFELSETGWGEFELSMTIFFSSDASEKPLELFHQLKLYPEDEGGAPQTTKKPVVVESYDEIVFSEPSEALLLRIYNHPCVAVTGSLNDLALPPPPGGDENVSDKKRGDTKDHRLGQWFLTHNDADELATITSARQQIQGQVAKLKRELSVLETEAVRLKANPMPLL